MTKLLLPTLAGLLLLTGCAQHYVIVRTDYSRIYVAHKPKLKDGYYYYKNGNGEEESISSGRVIEVGPVSMVTNPTDRFKPVHSK